MDVPVTARRGDTAIKAGIRLYAVVAVVAGFFTFPGDPVAAARRLAAGQARVGLDFVAIVTGLKALLALR